MASESIFNMAWNHYVYCVTPTFDSNDLWELHPAIIIRVLPAAQPLLTLIESIIEAIQVTALESSPKWKHVSPWAPGPPLSCKNKGWPLTDPTKPFWVGKTFPRFSQKRLKMVEGWQLNKNVWSQVESRQDTQQFLALFSDLPAAQPCPTKSIPSFTARLGHRWNETLVAWVSSGSIKHYGNYKQHRKQKELGEITRSRNQIPTATKNDSAKTTWQL